MAEKSDISDSLFYMWRCVIAIAHADGKIAAQERAYLENVMANLDRVYNLSEDQRTALKTDLDRPQKISDLLPRVTLPADRASLIYFGDVLASADGERSADEDAVLKKLHDDQMSKIDVEKLRAEIDADMAKRRDERAREMKQIHADEDKKHRVFAALDRLMLRFGFDILD